MSRPYSLAAALQSGLEQLHCPLDDAKQQQLLDYIALLNKWNRAYNLTAIREPLDMLYQHILDSLSIGPYLSGGHILDVGTGAGIPGIPLAIAHPEKQFVLVDSNGKKTRFMIQAVAELNLSNVDVVHSRVELLTNDQGFTTIVSRAFASLSDFVNACAHLCADQTVLLAMKGKHPGDEIAALPMTWQISSETELHVPGVNADRRVIRIVKKN